MIILTICCLYIMLYLVALTHYVITIAIPAEIAEWKANYRASRKRRQ